jgi:hypothetical protein
MNILLLNKKQINTLYQIISNDAGRTDRKTSVDYKESIQSLDTIFGKLYKKNYQPEL